jgi:hypothetical protein
MALAVQLDDPSLVSAALDAIGSEKHLTDPAEARRIAERRVAMMDRLTIQERSDAHFMVAWMSALLGDLPVVLATTEGWLAQIQPGQGPGFAVGLSAWRTYALWQLGRWDEVSGSFDNMRSLWIEANRIAAAYALQGMYAAMEVARARGDAALLDRSREMFDETIGRFNAGRPTRALAALGAPDPAKIATDIVGHPERFLERPVHVEVALALCSDRGYRLSGDDLQPILDRAVRVGLRPVEAQSRRALGIGQGDAAELQKALSIFTAVGSPPYAARVRTEIGLLVGDTDLLEVGLAELESLGDRDQLGRVNARRNRLSS